MFHSTTEERVKEKKERKKRKGSIKVLKLHEIQNRMEKKKKEEENGRGNGKPINGASRIVAFSGRVSQGSPDLSTFISSEPFSVSFVARSCS